jgi:2-haloacid dehalogenase
MGVPQVITFDCYDTLVDFAIDPTTVSILGTRTEAVNVDAFLAAFAQQRVVEEAAPVYRPYREVLSRSLERTMVAFGLPYRDEDGEALVAAIPTFGPFPEVPAALERLRPHCQLVILSNSDDDLMAGNVRTIGVPFDRVITAQQAQAYKPSPAIFRYAWEQLGCTPDHVLHVAQDFAGDMVPAAKLGVARVWINRFGKHGDPAYPPDHELPDLSGLPGLLGLQASNGSDNSPAR